MLDDLFGLVGTAGMRARAVIALMPLAFDSDHWQVPASP